MENNDIKQLEEDIKKHKEEKNLIECLSALEQILKLKTERYGKHSEEFIRSAKDLCEVCNLIAMTFLESGQKETGLQFLLKAEQLFKGYKDLLNICYNNLGCFYKFIGKSNLSVQYFEKALKLAYELDDKKKAAESHLNTSTVLNSLGKYKLAAEQCLSCVILMQEYLNETFEKKDNLSEEEQKAMFNDSIVLILAYQNLAMQYEHLQMNSQALLYYQIAEQLYLSFQQFSGVGDNFNQIVDTNYKIKLIKKLDGERPDQNADKFGATMQRKFINNLKNKFGINHGATNTSMTMAVQHKGGDNNESAINQPVKEDSMENRETDVKKSVEMSNISQDKGHNMNTSNIAEENNMSQQENKEESKGSNNLGENTA